MTDAKRLHRTLCWVFLFVVLGVKSMRTLGTLPASEELSGNLGLCVPLVDANSFDCGGPVTEH